MSSPVIIIDESLFNKLINKVDKLTEKVDNLNLKGNDGLKTKWYVSDEVCKILNISKRTLQKMRDGSIIQFKKSGKKIYYKASDIESYLEKI